MIEALLFFTVDRLDVTPIAAKIIKVFGDLHGMLSANADMLESAGVPSQARSLIIRVSESKHILMSEGLKERPHLHHASLIRRYIVRKGGVSTGWAVLHLDTRNRLLHDQRLPNSIITADLVRMAVTQALRCHAVAVVIVALHDGISCFGLKDYEATDVCRTAFNALSITLHGLLNFDISEEGFSACPDNVQSSISTGRCKNDIAMSSTACFLPRHVTRSGQVTAGLAERLPPKSSFLPKSLACLASTNDQSEEKETETLRYLLSITAKTPAEDFASQLISRYGSFGKVLTAPASDLLSISGLGNNSVAMLKLVYALVLRSARAALVGRPISEAWAHLLAYLRLAISRERVEHFCLLFVDHNGGLMADEAQVRGTVNHTPVYPREVAKQALELNAASVVLVHNHPSGDPTPSREDVEMTHLVRIATEAVGVKVYDHVVVAIGRCFSFREAGLLL